MRRILTTQQHNKKSLDHLPKDQVEKEMAAVGEIERVESCHRHLHYFSYLRLHDPFSCQQNLITNHKPYGFHYTKLF